jgi:hypothetical protein
MSAPPVELLAEYNMAEEKPGLHIDTDWKKQAQEEKKKLAEEEAKRRSASAGGAVAPVGVVPGAATAAPAGAPAAGRQGRGGRREERELPPASIMMVVQSLVTQVLLYLGEVMARGMQPTLDLDMAKHNLDLLGILEEKTKGNLTPEENQYMEAALYEARMRFISVASRVAELP